MPSDSLVVVWRQTNIFCKGLENTYLGFEGHMDFITTTQLCCFIFGSAGMEPRAVHMLDKFFTTEISPGPSSL